MQGGADELERRPQSDEERDPVVGSQVGELEQDGQVVGELAVGERQPCLGVVALEAYELDAALAAVAVGVPGQVHGGAPVEVERFDVRLAQDGRRGRA